MVGDGERIAVAVVAEPELAFSRKLCRLPRLNCTHQPGSADRCITRPG